MLEIAVRLARGSFALHVDFRLDRRISGVSGPSGAGKTTLMLAVAGLLRPDCGRIILDGEVLFDSCRRIHVPSHRRRIGVVFQDDRLFPHLTVRQNLGFGERLLPRGQRRMDLDGVAELLELERFYDRSVQDLSGGERQRVALGRAILASPRLLLLDEPLASLDQERKSRILPLLRRVQESFQIPMILVSHDLGEIRSLAEHLIVLHHGRITAQGAPLDLISPPSDPAPRVFSPSPPIGQRKYPLCDSLRLLLAASTAPERS